MNPQLWWYVTRASGLVAWGLSVAAVLWGMALATRALGDRPRPAWLLDLHRFLGVLTLAANAVHLIALVADSFVTFGWAELFVPMASPWKPGALAWGIVAFYLLVAIQVTSWNMRRIPKVWWKRVHMSSYLMAVAATGHGVAAGTDAGNPLFQYGVMGSMSAMVFFLVYRALVPKRRAAAQRAAAPAGVMAAAKAAKAAASAGAN